MTIYSIFGSILVYGTMISLLFAIAVHEIGQIRSLLQELIQQIKEQQP